MPGGGRECAQFCRGFAAHALNTCVVLDQQDHGGGPLGERRGRAGAGGETGQGRVRGDVLGRIQKV